MSNVGERKRFADFEDHASVEEIEGRIFVIERILLAHLNFLVIVTCTLDLSFRKVSIWSPYLNAPYFAI